MKQLYLDPQISLAKGQAVRKKNGIRRFMNKLIHHMKHHMTYRDGRILNEALCESDILSHQEKEELLNALDFMREKDKPKLQVNASDNTQNFYL